MTPTELAPARLNVPQAAVMGLTTLAWYALPDVIRSRGVRTTLKLGLLGLGSAGWVLARPEKAVPAGAQGPDLLDEMFEALRAAPGKSLGLGTAVIAMTVAGTVAGEKAIFGFGERRRVRGVRGAHTLPALALGVLGAATAVVPLEP